MAGEQGYQRPAGFWARKLVSHVYTDPRDAGNSRTVEYYIHNCQRDAFKTAEATLLDRKLRYGSSSVQLSRWIEAQIKVFAQCSGETAFVPPEEPASDWLPLEQHDRRYQIAAAYFYNGQYLEAASRFGEMGRTADSPWRDLGRYLVARSLARKATVNENDSAHHLGLALQCLSRIGRRSRISCGLPFRVRSNPPHPREARCHGRPTRSRTANLRRSTPRACRRKTCSTTPTCSDVPGRLAEEAIGRGTEGATNYERWLWYATTYRSTPEGAVIEALPPHPSTRPVVGCRTGTVRASTRQALRSRQDHLRLSGILAMDGAGRRPDLLGLARLPTDSRPRNVRFDVAKLVVLRTA